MTSDPLGPDLLQGFADRLEGVVGLRAVGAATLRHIGPATTALPTQGGNGGLDEFYGANLRRKVIGDADGYACTAFIDRDEGSNAASEALLHPVDLSAKPLWIEAIDDLRQTLAAGNPPVASLDDIEAAAEVLREERASVGGRQARLEGRTEEIEASLVDTQKLLGSIEDADLTVSISELTQLQTALQATLATASTLQTSILDYFE